MCPCPHQKEENGDAEGCAAREGAILYGSEEGSEAEMQGMEQLEGQPGAPVFTSPVWPLKMLEFVALESLPGAGPKYPGLWPSSLNTPPASKQHPVTRGLNMRLVSVPLPGMTFPTFLPPPWSSPLCGELLHILPG